MGSPRGVGVHERFGESREVDFLESAEKWSEVKRTAAGHLEKLLVAGLFLVGAGAELLAVKEGDLVAEFGDELALHPGVLRKVVWREGETQVRMGCELSKPLHAIRGGKNLAAVILDRDGDPVFASGVRMGHHLIDESFHGGLQFVAFRALVAPGAADDEMATKAFRDREFEPESEGPEFVVGEDTELDFAFPEEFLESIESHLGDLFTMVGVGTGPDIDRARSSHTDFRKDLSEWSGAIHRRGNEVIELEVLLRLRGTGGAGESRGAGELAKSAAIHEW